MRRAVLAAAALALSGAGVTAADDGAAIGALAGDWTKAGIGNCSVLITRIETEGSAGTFSTVVARSGAAMAQNRFEVAGTDGGRLVLRYPDMGMTQHIAVTGEATFEVQTPDGKLIDAYERCP